MKCLAFDLGRVLFDFDYIIALDKIKDALGVPPNKIINELFYNNFATDYEKGLISNTNFIPVLLQPSVYPLIIMSLSIYGAIFLHPKQEVIDLLSRLKILYPLYLISNINELHFKAFAEKISAGFFTF